MTYTPIPAGTTSWNVPLEANLADLQNQITSNGTRLTNLEVTPVTKTGALASSATYAALVTGDTFDRWRVYADGKLEWGSGAGARDTTLTRSGANALTCSGFFAMNTGQSSGTFSAFGASPQALTIGSAGGGLAVKEGTNARMGTSVLVAGTVTVANTSVTATTRVFLTSQVDGGTVGFLRVSTRTAGTSFTITSSSATDTSTVAWHLVEAA